MSLTSELRAGPLADWFAATFPDPTRIAAGLTAQLARRRPVRPPGRVSGRHWAQVGGAFGQRLGFAVETSPPYYALLGAHHAGLISWDDTAALTALFPTHTELPAPGPGHPDDRLLDRPSRPGGSTYDHPPPPGRTAPPTAPTPTPPRCSPATPHPGDCSPTPPLNRPCPAPA